MMRKTSSQEALSMPRDVIGEIIQLRDVLPKKQKILCNYIVLNHAQVGIMTVVELATKAGVGTTTVMRLIQLLHYDSFSAFKRDLLNSSIMQENSSYRNQKQAIMSRQKGRSTLLDISNDITRSVENCLTPSNLEQFEQMVSLLLGARNIYILGLRSSRVAALHFEDATRNFCSNVRQLSNEQEFLYDRLLQIEAEDVLIALSQWPCTKKTIEVATVFHQKGVPVALITNTALNPIARFAQTIIDTNSVGSSCDVVLLTAITSALATEIGRRTVSQSTRQLDALEQMLKDHNLILWETNL